MNNVELKDALMDGRKIMYGGIEYDSVSAIIYRNRGGKIAITAELLDKGSNSVVIASIDKIQEVEA